jgi:hypothetical protein
MKWNDNETRNVVKLYRKMLNLQESGKLGPKKSAGQVSKAQLVRDWIAKNGDCRNKQSVELKLMNVSAVFQKLGLTTVVGYKPLKNYAKSLETFCS